MPEDTARLLLIALLEAFLVVAPALGQQKGQWIPGQSGLDAGVLPDAGLTYANITVNYSSDSFNNSNGNAVPVQGSYGVWAVENIFYYVAPFHILGGKFAPMLEVPIANGSLTVPQYGINFGGYGVADLWVQPVTLGWHFSTADSYVAYAFVAPTGRFTAGATNNVGSGYWGNHIATGTTVYLTKNRGTTANLTTDWEIHGQKSGTDVTPGQAFTTEWGLGQILPLDKQQKKLLQVGLIGYDQWQVSDNTGMTTLGVPASKLPYYSVHAIGFQTNFILPAKKLNFYFKYEPEYRAKGHSQGTTLVFGGSWTLEMPKADAGS